MPVNNTIKIFLMILKIILYYFLFIKYLWIYKLSLVSIGLSSTGENFTILFNPVFILKLIIAKYFGILPKHSALSLISDSFALN